MTDARKDLPRLSDAALGPCFKCGRVMLGTGLPMFYRVTSEQCGIDRDVIDKHVGLAMMFGGGGNGLALAGVMGTGEKPVVVLGSGTANLCTSCSQSRVDFMQVAAATLEPREGAAT